MNFVINFFFLENKRGERMKNDRARCFPSKAGGRALARWKNISDVSSYETPTIISHYEAVKK